MKSKRSQSFLGGAAVLAAAGIISKVFGAVYRIPLARLIGAEGMGLYGMAYPLYAMILALSTAGVPVAISKLVAEKLAQGRPREARQVFRVALEALFVSGLVFSLLLFGLARFMVGWGFLRDARAYWPVAAISPAIFLVAVASALRGFFQGQQNMMPTAVSQVLEQLLRAGTALLLGYLLLERGIEFAAAGAAFGAVTGAAGALAVLLWYMRREGLTLRERVEPGARWGILGTVFSLAVPVSLAGLVMPIIQNLDVIIVPRRLEVAGYGVREATALFGQLSQMAATLINLPTIITVALSVSLVPAISAAVAGGDKAVLRARMETALRLTVLLELPAFVGLFVLARPVMALLYDLPAAGTALASLSASCLFLGLHQTTSGILQGLGRTDIPVRSLVVGAAVKVVFTYVLTAIPALGIRGAALGTVATFVVAAILNSLAIERLVGFPWNARELLLKPGAAAIIMAACVRIGYRLLLPLVGTSLTTLLAILIGVVTYSLALIVVRAVRPEDLELLPGPGRAIARYLRVPSPARR
ncbi:MAG: stage sporulation protein [Bacillota bacterium]|nr:stage sporulation protein [Bacillota bacterium]